MPQMGESVVEGTILNWLKKEGDTVEVDEALVEVSTDKVDTEIPSPVAGVITKILVPEGETVDVGTPLVEIDESGNGAAKAPSTADEKAEEAEEKPPPEPPAEPARQEEAPIERPAARGPEPAPAPEPEPEPEPERPAARGEEAGAGQVLSPLVRRLAREHNVDPTLIRGTGAGGRVTKEDVLAYVERGDGQRAAPAAAPAPAPVQHRGAAEAPAPAGPPAVREPAGDRTATEPLTHVRKRIAEHMVRSLQTSARAWNAIEVDMEQIARVRESANAAFRQREGFSLTFLPFIARATCDALAAHPVANASVSEDVGEVTYHNYVNLGIAVATDYGLIVPVVKGADGLTVVGLARAIRDLAERARDRKLNPDDVSGSTFTITNPGPFGSYLSVPVINQPNVAILSTEVVEKRVVVVDGMIAVRHRMFLSMSWDHRLLDGADAMRFLQRLKENLETWDFTHEVT
jgi:2-oxoglutarate dehydrogenase E2 component (dihydrolipoamide succinyltransferase)